MLSVAKKILPGNGKILAIDNLFTKKVTFPLFLIMSKFSSSSQKAYDSFLYDRNFEIKRAKIVPFGPCIVDNPPESVPNGQRIVDDPLEIVPFGPCFVDENIETYLKNKVPGT